MQPSAFHVGLLSFPTRRSSDLLGELPRNARELGRHSGAAGPVAGGTCCDALGQDAAAVNRLPRLHQCGIASRTRCGLLRSEETRLNSSHSQISYAVFCLKKTKL